MRDTDGPDQALSLIQELDGSAATHGAAVLVENHPDETLVIGNRAGLLRLGLEIMKAAFADPDPKYGGYADSVPLALDDFVQTKEPLLFRRVTHVPDPKAPTFLQRRVMPALFLSVLVLILLLALVGFATIGAWLFS